MDRIRAASRGLRAAPSEKLGTFIGVFTPSMLTILGVILFLRIGWVVGNVGLAGAVVIVVVANLVTLATALSVSAVATNMRVGAGGAYYIISRSLGVEIGAAIGIPLFLAQAFSVTLYAFGLAESLQLINDDIPQRPVAALTVLVVAFLASRGAGIALRLQLPIMAGIGVSLVVLATGVIRNTGGTIDVTAVAQGAEPFWEVFAVFFPAVTGIMAGISLSGDLRKPDVAIPRGTIGAVLGGFAVYVAVAIGLGLAANPAELATDTLIWFTLAGGASFLIFPGLWGAIFSSAVGSILGGPRTLKAMVDDRVLPHWLGLPLGRVRGPGVPLLVTLLVSMTAVLLGDLNAVAPALSMFFLTTYGMVNLVAGVEKLTGDPSYRPRLDVPWWVSLLGAAASFWVMFLISPIALAIAVVFEFGVYLIMRRRALAAPWGDLRRGALMALVRSAVIQISRLPSDPRNWRPNILLFAGDVHRRPGLVRFASWLVHDRGILTIAELLVGDAEELAPVARRRTAELAAEIEEFGVVAFAETEVVPDFADGAVTVAQANGIAGIESNTIMFGWSDKPERRVSMLRVIERVAVLGISSVICRPAPVDLVRQRRRIHVWWGGLQQNGDMLALFAHLISLNAAWRDAQITINSIATSEMMLERTSLLLDRVITAARIDATPDVFLKPPDATVQQVIRKRSESADVVLLGLRSVEPGGEADYAGRLDELIDGLPTVLLVRSAGEFRGRLLGDPDRRPLEQQSSRSVPTG